VCVGDCAFVSVCVYVNVCGGVTVCVRAYVCVPVCACVLRASVRVCNGCVNGENCTNTSRKLHEQQQKTERIPVEY